MDSSRTLRVSFPMAKPRSSIPKLSAVTVVLPLARVMFIPAVFWRRYAMPDVPGGPTIGIYIA